MEIDTAKDAGNLTVVVECSRLKCLAGRSELAAVVYKTASGILGGRKQHLTKIVDGEGARLRTKIHLGAVRHSKRLLGRRQSLGHNADKRHRAFVVDENRRNRCVDHDLPEVRDNIVCVFVGRADTTASAASAAAPQKRYTNDCHTEPCISHLKPPYRLATMVGSEFVPRRVLLPITYYRNAPSFPLYRLPR